MTTRQSLAQRRKFWTVTPLLGLTIAVGVALVSQPVSAQTSADGLELIAATRQTDADTVRRLLAGGTDANSRYGDGTTALHWAAHRDTVTTVTQLLDAGADVNATDDHGTTPLALACLNGSLPVVQSLLTAGADPNLPAPVAKPRS